jgi:hypothetical protein
MTDLNNQNKLQKYKDRVYNFLDGNRYDEESKERPTHIAYGGFTGKFTLSGEKQKEFMRLYTSAIKHGIFDMSILVSYLSRFCAASIKQSGDGISKDKSFI